MKTSPLAPKNPPILHPVQGIRIAVAQSGMKYQGRDDVALIIVDDGAVIAGGLTRSETRSAAVDWCRQGLNNAAAKAVLVNAGNSNAFTGAAGAQSVQRCAEAAGLELGCKPEAILIASTGVIGEPMQDSLITRHIPTMAKNAAADAWDKAAKAIMTTDTFPKAASTQFNIDNTHITITGIAKGSGMIAPDMATMLAFIATDAAVDPQDLKRITKKAIKHSFNAITVDSDTSTSDTTIVIATGKSGEMLQGKGLKIFAKQLRAMMTDLAGQIVRDGEGAEKFITITVTGAKNNKSARKIGRAIANSPLVKTAMAGEDPNWGRIVMAVGKSGEKADRDTLSINIGGITIAKDGQRVKGYDEEPVAEHMKNDEITIAVDIGIGKGRAVIWTCDLTHGYIDINADYRS